MKPGFVQETIFSRFRGHPASSGPSETAHSAAVDMGGECHGCRLSWTLQAGRVHVSCNMTQPFRRFWFRVSELPVAVRSTLITSAMATDSEDDVPLSMKRKPSTEAAKPAPKPAAPKPAPAKLVPAAKPAPAKPAAPAVKEEAKSAEKAPAVKKEEPTAVKKEEPKGGAESSGGLATWANGAQICGSGWVSRTSPSPALRADDDVPLAAVKREKLAAKASAGALWIEGRSGRYR
jgi:hypothetical protein